MLRIRTLTVFPHLVYINSTTLTYLSVYPPYCSVLKSGFLALYRICIVLNILESSLKRSLLGSALARRIVHLGPVDWRLRIIERQARLYHMAYSIFSHAAMQAIIGGLLALLDQIVNLTACCRGFLQRLQPCAADIDARVTNPVRYSFADHHHQASLMG